jgi:hypothetical protein
VPRVEGISVTSPRIAHDRRFDELLDQLAMIPDSAGVLARLTRGHEPDRHGWCAHPAHSHKWERSPCWVVRLAGLVRAH